MTGSSNHSEDPVFILKTRNGEYESNHYFQQLFFSIFAGLILFLI